MEKSEKVKSDIEKVDTKMAELRKKRKRLTDELKKVQVDELLDVVGKSGKSLADVKQMLMGNSLPERTPKDETE